MTKSPIKKSVNSGQFPKGRSGNAGGRPVATPRPQASALQIFADTTFTVNDRGKTREVTFQEVLQNQLLKRALAGDAGDRREVLKWIAQHDEWTRKHGPQEAPPVITRRVSHDPDNADAALVLLQIAAPHPLREPSNNRRMPLKIATWAAQAALRRRRGGARLTDDERDSVRRCIVDSETLCWPRGTGK